MRLGRWHYRSLYCCWESPGHSSQLRPLYLTSNGGGGLKYPCLHTQEGPRGDSFTPTAQQRRRCRDGPEVGVAFAVPFTCCQDNAIKANQCQLAVVGLPNDVRVLSDGSTSLGRHYMITPPMNLHGHLAKGSRRSWHFSLPWNACSVLPGENHNVFFIVFYTFMDIINILKLPNFLLIMPPPPIKHYSKTMSGYSMFI